MVNDEQKALIINDAVGQVNIEFEKACIDYGSRVCNKDFDPKSELRDLQIKKDAQESAKQIIRKTLKGVI